jgi:hypothetical protein
LFPELKEERQPLLDDAILSGYKYTEVKVNAKISTNNIQVYNLILFHRGVKKDVRSLTFLIF